MSKLRSFLIMFFILVVSVLLRLMGLRWGLPDYLHYYSYHPDENVLFAAITNIDIFNGIFDPGFYNYGSLYIYLVNIAVTLSAVFGWINLAITDIGADIAKIADMYLVGRIVAVTMSIAGIYFLYVFGKKAYGEREGILAALFLSILPIYVMHSDFMAVDVPSTLFIIISMIFAVRLLDGCKLCDYLFAGLFAGFAAGTKYNAGLIFIVPFIIHFYANKSAFFAKLIDLKLILMAIFAGFGFVIGTPGIFLNQDQFIKDFMFEVNHISTGHGLVFVQTGSGYIYHIFHSFLPGMGLPLLLLSAIGIIYAIRKHNPIDVALLGFILVYFIIIGSAEVRFARYIIPVLPVLVLFASRLSVSIFSYLAVRKGIARLVHMFSSFILILVIVYTAAYSVSIGSMMVTADTRDESIEWIRDNIEKGSTIGLPTIPWFYTVPFDPEMASSINANQRLEAAQDFTDYLLTVSSVHEWNIDFLIQESPKYVVISELEAVDRLRIKDISANSYYKYLKSHYDIYKEFKKEPNILGIKFPLLVSFPHDMSYADPDIVIYMKKGNN